MWKIRSGQVFLSGPVKKSHVEIRYNLCWCEKPNENSWFPPVLSFIEKASQPTYVSEKYIHSFRIPLLSCKFHSNCFIPPTAILGNRHSRGCFPWPPQIYPVQVAGKSLYFSHIPINRVSYLLFCYSLCLLQGENYWNKLVLMFFFWNNIIELMQKKA